MGGKKAGLDNVIICGPNGRVTASSVSRAERKTISNFAEFLRGKGTRCPHCLHKAKKHAIVAGCFGKGCDCVTNEGWIRRWWDKRREGTR